MNFFGLLKIRPARAAAARFDKIAREHGASFVEHNVIDHTTPGTNNGNYSAWFEAENRGDSENRKKGRDVLEACGLSSWQFCTTQRADGSGYTSGRLYTWEGQCNGMVCLTDTVTGKTSHETNACFDKRFIKIINR